MEMNNNFKNTCLDITSSDKKVILQVFFLILSNNQEIFTKYNLSYSEEFLNELMKWANIKS